MKMMALLYLALWGTAMPWICRLSWYLQVHQGFPFPVYGYLRQLEPHVHLDISTTIMDEILVLLGRADNFSTSRRDKGVTRVSKTSGLSLIVKTQDFGTQ
jgi:hypothetical protein